MLGVQAGGLVHVAAAAFGVSAIIASSATAFTIVTYVGAASLVLIGLRRPQARAEHDPEVGLGGAAAVPAGRDRQRLKPEDGALLPRLPSQFVDPFAGPVAPQMLVLGTLLVGLGVPSDGTSRAGALVFDG